MVPQRVLPQGVIAPHRRWMPESNPTDNGSRYWGTRCSTTRSPVDARKQSTEMYLESRNHTASQHLCEGLGALLPRHGHPVLPVGRRPRTKLSGDFNSSLVFLRRVTPLYNLVVGGPVRGPHGGTHPKAVSRGQTHPASGPFLPRHAALKARPLEQSGPHTGTLTHRVNTTGYPW